MINENTTLADILKIPGADKVLAKYKVPCLTCAFAQIEMEKLKIGDICKMYRIDAKKLLRDINKIYKK